MSSTCVQVPVETREVGHLKVELQAVMNCLLEVLGTQPWSSAGGRKHPCLLSHLFSLFLVLKENIGSAH